MKILDYIKKIFCCKFKKKNSLDNLLEDFTEQTDLDVILNTEYSK